MFLLGQLTMAAIFVAIVVGAIRDHRRKHEGAQN
jgi:hypothetical protein